MSYTIYKKPKKTKGLHREAFFNATVSFLLHIIVCICVFMIVFELQIKIVLQIASRLQPSELNIFLDFDCSTENSIWGQCLKK